MPANVTTDTDDTWLDATAQAELVRDRHITPLELVRAAISRIEQLDSALNSVVIERFDRALAEAGGELPDGPFRGVPIVFKDAGCHAAGELTTYGTRVLRDAAVPWPVDSHLARLFRRAGFVALGRTNVSELVTSMATEPGAYGPARNPYAPDRSPGGSSGGSAVAVAAGLVPVAHANDSGGSIRAPAALCGLVGFKPSRGRVSLGPDRIESWAGAHAEGVITRSVRDAAGVLDAISRPMPGEPYLAPPLPRTLVREVGAPLGLLRVGLLDAGADSEDADLGFPGEPARWDAIEHAGRLLEGLGCAVERSAPTALPHPEFERAFGKVIAVDIARTVSSFERLLGRRIDDDELEPRNRTYREIGRHLSAERYVEAREWLGVQARHIARWWAPEELGGNSFDLLVTPTVGMAAPELGWFTAAGVREEARRIAAFTRYTAQFNITGQPAVTLPLYWTDENLPLGVQLVAAYGREDLLVRVAAALEQAAPWAHRRPAIRVGTPNA